MEIHYKIMEINNVESLNRLIVQHIHYKNNFSQRVKGAITMASKLTWKKILEEYNYCTIHELKKTRKKGTMCHKCFMKEYIQSTKNK